MATSCKSKYSSQPDYSTSVRKALARKQIMMAYTALTGHLSLPVGYGYWTLCHRQPNIPGSEINQMTRSGFIAKSQYFGIDFDEKKEGFIQANKKDHPEAHWFEGHWLDVIRDNYDLFSPALVHFDSTQTVQGLGFHKTLAETLNICKRVGVIVVATAAVRRPYPPYEAYDPKELPKNLDNYLHHPASWGYLDVCHPYKTSRTDMGIHIFQKLGLPKAAPR